MSTPFLGEIRMFGFPRVPVGWQACDGTLLSIAQNDALYALIGTTYGGDGVNTFAVPDMRGRVPLHFGNGQGLTPRVLGERGGTENVTLASTQLPAHNHPMFATTATAESTKVDATLELGTLGSDTLYVTDTSNLTGYNTSPHSTLPTGNSAPHNNLMPTLTVQFCIATAGVFPSQG
ncbi:phage tail protein [Ensifer sp. NPDC090286]|uniref:phage tail protein n=1 Tax=Ensifer sp. NPDC090286 TaxID=3363991 RepID=UPI00383AC4B0